MRVTFNALNNGLDAINLAADQFVEAQFQVSTGKRLRALSTDPAAAQRSVVERSEQANIDSYADAGSAASTRLASMDQTLSDLVEQIQRAKVAASSGHPDTASPTTRAAAAITLAGVRDAMAADINTQVDGVHVFSGARSGTQAYARNGAGAWVYQGDAQAVRTEVDNGRSVNMTMDGQAILQGSDTTDLLSTMDALVTAVQNGDGAGINSGFDALERAFQRTSRALSTVGTDEVSVEDSGAHLVKLQLASEKRISKLEDANLADAVVRMSRAQTAYNAALGAVGTTSRNSLLNYLT